MKQIHLHHLGHTLFFTGAFLVLIGIVILTPLSENAAKAFGVSDIANLCNKARRQLNAPELTIDHDLMNAAQMKAEDMAKQRYFAHSSPDGTVAWDYLRKVSYNYSVAGENLAVTNQDAETVVVSWLNSPSHRDNLLSKNYSDFGVGMAYYGDYESHKDTSVIVVMYGKRASASVQDIAATTNPAGPSVSLQPDYIRISPAYIAIVASLLMSAGLFLEFLHLKHTHLSHNIA
jgi:hypothetical protein